MRERDFGLSSDRQEALNFARCGLATLATALHKITWMFLVFSVTFIMSKNICTEAAKMDNTLIIEKLNSALSDKFGDYRGTYFFGSRLTGNFTEDSDYDVVLVFDVLDREKQRLIMRVVSELEYELEVFLDCKLFTSTGSRSIDYIRKNVNPVFIERAIDLGKYYGRT